MAKAHETSPAENGYILVSDSEADSTHCYGETQIAPARIVRRFGEGNEGDGYKVSRQWVFRKENLVFTIYDWKSTDLYETDLSTPEELWRIEWPFDLHIGSKEPATEADAKAFEAYLQKTTTDDAQRY